MAERSATFSTSPFWMRVRKASIASLVMSRLEGIDIVGDVAAGGYRLNFLGAFVMHHAAARSFDYALSSGELLADARESRRANLVGFEIYVDAFGKLERQREVIQDLHGRAHLGAGHADGANGMRVQEPVQHIEIVAILLHDEVARVIPVAEPIAQMLDLGVVVRRALE